MALQDQLEHELDLDRHAGEIAPTEPPPKPSLGSTFDLDPNVIDGTQYKQSSSSGIAKSV
jgi:hypothetical protein